MTGHECVVCGDKVTSIPELSLHLFQHSIQPGNYPCTLCDENFHCPEKLEFHKASHFTDCELCGKHCHDSRTLSRHLYNCRRRKSPKICNGNLACVATPFKEESGDNFDLEDKLDCGSVDLDADVDTSDMVFNNVKQEEGEHIVKSEKVSPLPCDDINAEKHLPVKVEIEEKGDNAWEMDKVVPDGEKDCYDYDVTVNDDDLNDEDYVGDIGFKRKRKAYMKGKANKKVKSRQSKAEKNRLLLEESFVHVEDNEAEKILHHLSMNLSVTDIPVVKQEFDNCHSHFDTEVENKEHNGGKVKIITEEIKQKIEEESATENGFKSQIIDIISMNDAPCMKKKQCPICSLFYPPSNFKRHTDKCNGGGKIKKKKSHSTKCNLYYPTSNFNRHFVSCNGEKKMATKPKSRNSRKKEIPEEQRKQRGKRMDFAHAINEKYKSFPCDICYVEFERRDEWKCHRKIVHNQNILFNRGIIIPSAKSMFKELKGQHDILKDADEKTPIKDCIQDAQVFDSECIYCGKVYENFTDVYHHHLKWKLFIISESFEHIYPTECTEAKNDKTFEILVENLTEKQKIVFSEVKKKFTNFKWTIYHFPEVKILLNDSEVESLLYLSPGEYTKMFRKKYFDLVKDKNFVCKVCDKYYANPSCLEKHQRDFHMRSKEVVCHLCGLSFIKKRSLTKHLYKKHGEFPVFQRKRNKIPSEVQETMLRSCVFCNKMLQNRNMSDHIQKFHPEMTWAKSTLDGMGVCQSCHQFKVNLKDHAESAECTPNDRPPVALIKMRENANQRKFELKQWKIKENVDVSENIESNGKHMNTHFGQCGSCAKQCSDLKRHIWFCHSTTKDEKQKVYREKELAKAAKYNRLFDCNFCEETYTTKNSLRDHEVSEHPESSDMTHLSPFNCVQCDKRFYTLNGYRNHMGSVHNSKVELTSKTAIECPECRKIQRTLDHLRAHLLTHFPDKKRFKCELCGESFVHANSLRHHKIQNHGLDAKSIGNVFKFTCSYEQCNGRYQYKTALNRHLVIEHGEPAPDWAVKKEHYLCQVCHTGFASLDTILDHFESKHESAQNGDGLQDSLDIEC